jgi:hypothetical protein
MCMRIKYEFKNENDLFQSVDKKRTKKGVYEKRKRRILNTINGVHERVE